MPGSANLSPSVDVIERDVSLRVPSVNSSVGAIVVAATKGPINVRVLVNTEKDYVDTFGEPDEVNYRHFFTAKSFLEGSTQLYVVRVEDNDKKVAGLTIGLSPNPSGGLDVGGYFTPLPAKDFPVTYDVIPISGLAYDPSNNPIFPAGELYYFWGVGAGPYYEDVQVCIINKDDYKVLVKFKEELTQTVTDKERQAVIYKYYTGTSAPATTADPGFAAFWQGITPPPPTHFIFDTSGTYLNNNPLKNDLISQVGTEWVVKFGLLEQFTSFEYGPEEPDEFVLFVYFKGNLEEKYLCSKLKDKRDTMGNKMFGPELVNGRSRFIYFFIGDDEDAAAGVPLYTTGLHSLGGADPLTTNLFSLVGEIEKAWRTFFTNKEEVEIDILLDPDYPTILKRSLDDICKNVRKDCFAVLNIPFNEMANPSNAKPLPMVYTNMADYVNTKLNINSSYSAIYGQYFEIFDFYKEKFRWVPVTGYVGAVFARVDFNYDPWYAAAGLNRGIISGINRVLLNPTKPQRDILYSNRINPIPNFIGQGVVIWGQKTLQAKPSAFDRINVRRLFLYMERSIEKLAKYFLFEFNDEITRARFTGLVNGFLSDIKTRRGITDYLVVADESNNTPDVIDRNEFIAEILVKPNRVIEFIKLIFTAVGTGTDFSEVVGKGGSV